MGLFDKKYCDVCGDKIGFLGNRKLEDGNLCKECAAKLSPWFTDRRRSTVESIKEQLAYREENRSAVAAFHVTRSMGENVKVLLDEDARKFMVTDARDLQEANPDVLDFAQVTGCDLDIDEDRTEEMREVKKPDGKTEEVSYNPPRYTYSYEFNFSIRVNHPYFDEMRIQLNREDVTIRPVPGRVRGAPNVRACPDYTRFKNMGEELRTLLMEARQTVRDEAAAAAAPKSAVTCPFCGATVVPDANGRCEYCGGAVNG